MSVELRRGFKAECERVSRSTRSELGLTLLDPLDCIQLATHLGIPIVSLLELSGEASHISIKRLLAPNSRFWALTVCVGTKRLIIYNPRQPPGRRANSLAHELSHVILEHPATPALGMGGCRQWDPILEGEADWLAGALLVPRDGALAWLKKERSIEDGAKHYGVSLALFRWRVNQTGVSRQLSYRQRAAVP